MKKYWRPVKITHKKSIRLNVYASPALTTRPPIHLQYQPSVYLIYCLLTSEKVKIDIRYF